MKQNFYFIKYFSLTVIIGFFLSIAFPLSITAQGTSADTGSWQIITPASGSFSGREENSYAAAGDKFYLIGGRGILPVQEYNPVTKSWVNKARPPIEMNHFQAVTLNGLIYMVGAMNQSYPHEVPLTQVYMYNPTSNKWLNGSVIPSGRRRGGAGAVAYKNKIYVVGGITDGHYEGWVNWFDEYDPATNTWKVMPNAPRVRDHFQGVIINDKLYVAGGRRSSYKTGQTFELTIPEVDVFDFVSGTWSTLPSSSNFPIPRAGAANVALGNEVIVIGGESILHTVAHNETHALNVATNTWRRLADLKEGTHGTGAVVSNQDIYIAAGAGNRGGSPKVLTQQDYFVTSHTAPNGTALSQSTLGGSADISFGSITANTESTKILTLSNTGSNQDILFSSIAISGSGSFSYTAPYTFPFTVSPGKSIDITVKFSPASAGAQTANLTVTHSGLTGSKTVSLSGTGTSGTGIEVTTFTLINAATDTDIQTLNEGDVLNLATLPTRNLNIRANTNPATIGSVVFNMSGQLTKIQKESTYPLALFGDNNGNYNNWTPAVGNYTLKGTPYSASGGTGTAGTPLTINFSVTDQTAGNLQLTTFTLINSSTDQDIRTLQDGDVINLATTGTNLNIRANTSAGAGSVVFNLNGVLKTESTAPYSYYGDNNGNYNNWTPATGSYTLKGTPYSGKSGTGTAGTALTVGFTVTNQAGITAQRKTKEPVTDQGSFTAAKAYPNPNSKGNFTVLLPQKFEGDVSFTLGSLAGNRLKNGKLFLKKPTSVINFDFSQEMISAGFYYLQLQNKDQTVYVKLIRSK